MKINVNKEIDQLERHYQVFISSTFEDLKSYRISALNAILDHQCLPLGMEMFPSSDDEQLSYIKKIIDKCDFYLLIVGGRYGSRSKSGISFTEEEYKYARKQKKEIVALLLDENTKEYKDIFFEESDEDKKSLLDFRKEVRTGRIANSFLNEDKLMYEISRGLNEAKRRSGSELGLVRSREVLEVIASFEELDETQKDQYMQAINSLHNIASSEEQWRHICASLDALKSATHSLIYSGVDIRKNLHSADLLNSIIGLQRFVEGVVGLPVRVSIKQINFDNGKIKLRTISSTGGNISSKSRQKRLLPLSNYKGLEKLYKDIIHGGELEYWYCDDVIKELHENNFGIGSFSKQDFGKKTKDPSLIPYQTTLCHPIYNIDPFDSETPIVRGFLCLDTKESGQFNVDVIKLVAESYCSMLYLFMSVSDYLRSQPEVAKAISQSMFRQDVSSLMLQKKEVI